MTDEKSQIDVCRSFNGYCKKTLRNEACNAYMAMNRRHATELNYFDNTTLEKGVGKQDGAKNIFELEGQKIEISSEILSKGILTLSEDLRDVVLLYYFYDLNDKSIGRRKNIPRSTIQNKRSRALVLLRQFLEAYDDLCT